MPGIVKASGRPRRFAGATEGGFPRLSDGVARGLRCPAPSRHALLAENLGKPSLWVIVSAPWYKPVAQNPPNLEALIRAGWREAELSWEARQQEAAERAAGGAQEDAAALWAEGLPEAEQS